MEVQHDLVGRKFNRWTIIAPGEPEYSRSGKKVTNWYCRCECGTERVVRHGSLQSGRSTSCGCARRDYLDERARTAKNRHPLFITWQGIKARCFSPSNGQYKYYGGRGITMCDEWVNDMYAFVDYVGPKPGPEYTVDRIDSDGNYEPGNVRWATKAADCQPSALRC